MVTAHADVLRDLFEHRGQCHHFQPYLTGLIVLDNPSLATITRGGRDRADTTPLSRFFSEAPGFPARVKDRRLTSLLRQTTAVRSPQAEAALLRADPLGDHGGSLCAHSGAAL